MKRKRKQKKKAKLGWLSSVWAGLLLLGLVPVTGFLVGLMAGLIGWSVN